MTAAGSSDLEREHRVTVLLLADLVIDMDVAVDSLPTRSDLRSSTDTRDTAVGIGHGRRVLASSFAPSNDPLYPPD